ncbi:hypothetical protein CORC01_13316 [Colletotrichum orchidophilum]|uniref:Uncharacterized protein n=1 Tax=Colletotrichum orchidophilum TaxID=1209926 RepID=A0A1G4AQE3_9PEZI|nr:uncharacterized protein CORC01_13316 [Colletotrichum orchidophilum]OHE91398.1 hypothetical protein CORC01_13316 [Colletotrichum orchidophilum]
MLGVTFPLPMLTVDITKSIITARHPFRWYESPKQHSSSFVRFAFHGQLLQAIDIEPTNAKSNSWVPEQLRQLPTLQPRTHYSWAKEPCDQYPETTLLVKRSQVPCVCIVTWSYSAVLRQPHSADKSETVVVQSKGIRLKTQSQ